MKTRRILSGIMLGFFAMAFFSLPNGVIMPANAAEKPVIAEETVTAGKTVIAENGEYMLIEGPISKISASESGYILTVGKEQNATVFNLNEGIFIIDASSKAYMKLSDLKEDMIVSVVLPKNAPMTLSLPPISSAAVGIIVKQEGYTVAVKYFNEDLTSEDNTLKLNLSQETKIVDSRGAKRLYTADNVTNSNCMVLYTASTRSIPAQTNPELVVIMPAANQKQYIVEQYAKDSAVSVNGVQMVPLRAIAEAIGFQVSWDNENQAAVINNGSVKSTVSIGQNLYCYTSVKAIGMSKPEALEAAPILIKDSVFVPVSFFNMFVK